MKILLKPLICCAAILFGGSAASRAAEPLSDILSRASEGKLLKADFSCTIRTKQQTYSSTGTVKYQNGAYCLDTEPLVITDNTEVSWTVDMVAKEVTIEPSQGLTLLKGASVTPGYDSKGKLSSLEALLKDGTKASVKILKLELLRAVDIEEEFSYDHEGLDSFWVVTDLR